MRIALAIALLVAACGPVVETGPEPGDGGADAADGQDEAAPAKAMPLLPSDGQDCRSDAEVCGLKRWCDQDAGVCRWR